MVQEIVLSMVFQFATVFYLVNAFKMPFGKLVEPGPGFFPVILGLIAVSINTYLLVNAVLKYIRERQPRTREEKDNNPETWRFLAYLGMFIVLMLILETAGALLSIFLLVFGLTKISGVRGWTMPIFIGSATSILIIVVFDLLLGTPLPKGFFSLF